MTGYIGLPSVKIKNILTNGSLASSSTGWTENTNYYNYTQNEGYLTATLSNTPSSTSWYSTYQNFSTPISGPSLETRQVLYIQGKIRGNEQNVNEPYFIYRCNQTVNNETTTIWNRIQLSSTETGTVNDEEWHTYSVWVWTYNSESGNSWEYTSIRFGFRDMSHIGDTLDAKEIMVINLTESFGRGNEPSKVWCDNNITFVEDERIILDTYHSNASSEITEIKKIYIGNENNIPKKVRRAYVGNINSEPKQWYGLPTLTELFRAIGSLGTTGSNSASKSFLSREMGQYLTEVDEPYYIFFSVGGSLEIARINKLSDSTYTKEQIRYICPKDEGEFFNINSSNGTITSNNQIYGGFFLCLKFKYDIFNTSLIDYMFQNCSLSAVKYYKTSNGTFGDKTNFRLPKNETLNYTGICLIQARISNSSNGSTNFNCYSFSNWINPLEPIKSNPNQNNISYQQNTRLNRTTFIEEVYNNITYYTPALDITNTDTGITTTTTNCYGASYSVFKFSDDPKMFNYYYKNIKSY